MRYFLVLCAFVLPACGNPGTSSVEDVATAGANAVKAGVDAQRATTLRTDVVATGADCPAITRTFRQGVNADGGEFWNISCGAAGDYVVVLKAGQDAQVMRCDAARGVTGADCFTVLEAPR